MVRFIAEWGESVSQVKENKMKKQKVTIGAKLFIATLIISLVATSSAIYWVAIYG